MNKQYLNIILLKLLVSKYKSNEIILTKENTAAASFWDSPYHLSVKDDTWRLMKRQPNNTKKHTSNETLMNGC